MTNDESESLAKVRAVIERCNEPITDLESAARVTAASRTLVAMAPILADELERQFKLRDERDSERV